jgi:hypothetical protein
VALFHGRSVHAFLLPLSIKASYHLLVSALKALKPSVMEHVAVMYQSDGMVPVPARLCLE